MNTVTTPNAYTSTHAVLENETIEVGPGPFKIQFSSINGQMKRVINHRTGVSLPFLQSNCFTLA